MIWEAAEKIADALLYEGYLLYPYRGSAMKNRYRWQFGIVAPRDYHAAGGSEPWVMQTECLLDPGAHPILDLKVRFLQVEARQVEEPSGSPDQWDPVQSLSLEGRELVTWDEALPRDFLLSRVRLAQIEGTDVHPFEVPGGREVEVVRDAAGEIRARIIRERRPITCTVQLHVESLGGLRKLRVRVENTTAWSSAAESDRSGALRRSLLGAHTLLAVDDGAFISMVDPPAEAAGAFAACRNLHTWPVLVGEPPQRKLMLSSPIILYDYPAVAPESPGDLFDGTEIDEMLTLRVLTLTEGERQQARATDPRAVQVLERAATLPIRDLERLHGAIRYLGEPTPGSSERSALEEWLNPAGSEAEEAVDGAGRPVRRGSRVRLRPGPGADAMDMFLTEQTATVAAVYRDLEDQAHVAVTVDAGNAADLHESNGRYFYFRPEEIEVLDDEQWETPAEPKRTARVLVAGIGNVFLGDDGFGSAVVQRLASRTLPDRVRVEDFGIRSVHLAYDLLDAAYETTIVVDAVGRGGEPGTLYVLEPEMSEGQPEGPADAHGLSVEAVLGFLKGAGGDPGHVLIVGCEPLSLHPEMGLSEVVAGAVDGAVELVMELIAGTGE